MSNRIWATAVAVALVGTVGAAPMAAAQDGGSSASEGTTTSTPTQTTLPGGTGTTVPPTNPTTSVPPTTQPGPSGTTSTTIPGPPELIPPSPVTIPPELAGDPRAPILFDPSPGDGGDAPTSQPLFDPGSNQVLDAKVRELQAELLSKQRLLGEMQVQLLEQQIRVEQLTEALGTLEVESQANIAAAAAAERALRDHTVDAFMNGSTDDRMAMARTGDPVQLGVARELLGSVVDSDEELIAEHERAQARLDRRQQKLLSDLTSAQASYAEYNALFASTLQETLSEGLALRAYEQGAQIYVKGFVFPVQGEVEFIDSWGYPRMTGTASAHWHQGTDIFAPMGTPLVATESGTIFKVGTAGLGGQRLWLRGDSGTEYYYAHLIGFAKGMVDGVRVNAGDVVGYVGDTGNARGTPPHLHFQVHPNGADSDPVNPYPLLKATYGTRPMVQIVQAPPPVVPAPVDPVTGLPNQDLAAAPGLPPGTIPPNPDSSPSRSGG